MQSFFFFYTFQRALGTIFYWNRGLLFSIQCIISEAPNTTLGRPFRQIPSTKIIMSLLLSISLIFHPLPILSYLLSIFCVVVIQEFCPNSLWPITLRPARQYLQPIALQTMLKFPCAKTTMLCLNLCTPTSSSVYALRAKSAVPCVLICAASL